MNQFGTAPDLVLGVGEERVVGLASLAMSGYRWSAVVSGTTPAPVAVHLRRGELDGPAIPGRSAPEQAVLRGLRPGRAHVRLQQRRPWERDKPAAQEIEFDVTVQA